VVVEATAGGGGGVKELMARKMKLPIVFIALFVSLIYACVTSDILRLDSENRPARDPSEVQLLVEEPDQPYKSIAMITVSDEAWGLPLEELKTRLLSDAALLGGDAVIVGIESHDAGTVFSPISGYSFIGTNLEEKRLLGKVIVFEE
jgi:hypothetical protein